DLAGAELDVAGGAELLEALDAAGPVDRAGELAGQEAGGAGARGGGGGRGARLDPLGLTGDDPLAGGVGVGQEHLSDLPPDGAAELADGLVGEAEDDPHHPGAAGLVGELGPADDELQALLQSR